MQQVKRRCATARQYVAFVALFFAAALAFGQTGPVSFNVPYAFTVGSTKLPAGMYRFSISLQLSRLTVESPSAGTVGTNILSLISGPNAMFRGGYLVFEKTDGGLILSEIWLSGTNGALLHSIPKGHSRLALWGAGLNPNQHYSGREAFNLTCARCHGPNGRGNGAADKFFGLKIPRLASAVVQSKSDAELKQIITQGTSVMPPVEIDESGFRHRLPPGDVNAVIAYVRTLKH